MKKRFNKLAGILICITFAVFLLFIKDRVDYIWGAICTFATILTPFIYGFGIAYILNFPFRFFENKVFSKVKANWFQKIKRPLSLVLAYVLFTGIFAFLIAILIPQLFENISKLVQSIPGYIGTFRVSTSKLLETLKKSIPVDLSLIGNFNESIISFLKSLADLESLGNVYSAALNTAGVVYNWVMAFIISIYMLASKEFLYKQLKRFGAAFLPTKWLPTIYDIISIADLKCGKFLVGKLLDSTIIGVLCFICMSILRLPYAPLISVLVAICNIIPFFGPFIGGIPSAALLLMVDPMFCIEFIIMIFILQQIDGNIIGPKVVGSQVGLIGFWSLFSVIVAGGMFGLSGMILGTPIFAAIYTLVGRKMKKRIEMKGENAENVINMEVIKSNTLTNMKAKVSIKPKLSSLNLGSDKEEEDDVDENEDA